MRVTRRGALAEIVQAAYPWPLWREFQGFTLRPQLASAETVLEVVWEQWPGIVSLTLHVPTSVDLAALAGTLVEVNSELSEGAFERRVSQGGREGLVYLTHAFLDHEQSIDDAVILRSIDQCIQSGEMFLTRFQRAP